MKADRREDKITSGPISEVLSGIQYGDGRRKQVMYPPYIHPPSIMEKYSCICDALQQSREQVAQTYFEIWTIEVGIGMKK